MKQHIAFGLAWLPFMAAAQSLYQPENFQALTSDARLRHAGDLITVQVFENASATSAANTSAAREGGAGFALQAPGKSLAGNFTANQQTDGRGRTERSGRLLAQLTVVVKEVLPTGDLVLAGEQLVEINNERQQITVEGRVRPQDVSDTNVVLSSRIANAKLRYVGQGDLADKQRPAWWQRFITLFGG